MFRMFSYKLFTPGPLSTTHTVKAAMMGDFGASKSFSNVVDSVKASILRISKLSSEEYTPILLPGSGTFGVEATIRTAVSRQDKILIAANGAYGERMAQMCKILQIPHDVLRYDERCKVQVPDVLSRLSNEITHFSMVHSETTTGLLNDISEVASAVKKHNKNIVIIGDCVSSFGAVNADFSNLDYLVSCSNKLLQGVPGLALIIAKKKELEKCQGNSRSAMLDLYRIYKEGGNFVCTPPYQSVVALKQAIKEYDEEGGVEERQKRYQNNQRYLKTEMEKLGFRLYINEADQGWIISTFIEPKSKKYDFLKFYNYLVGRNIVIYPGKLSKLPTFRIGTIGELHEQDMKMCVECIKEAFHSMEVSLPLTD